MVWLLGFYGISTFVGYLKPNPFLWKQLHSKQLSPAQARRPNANTVQLWKTFPFQATQSSHAVLIQPIQFSVSTDFVYTVKFQNSSIFNNSV